MGGGMGRSPSMPSNSMMKPNGDWQCPKCNNLNYARRERCNRKPCEFKKEDLPGGMGMGGSSMNGSGGRRRGGPEPRPGDWECPRCYNLNFATRNRCNGSKDNERCNLEKPEFEKYGVAPVKTQHIAKDGDWDCWKCGNVNFKHRDECNKCKEEKEQAQHDCYRLSGVDSSRKSADD